MDYDALITLAKSNKWSDLEKGWLSAIESPEAQPEHLLPVIDLAVKAGQEPLANTLGWAWLETIKEGRSAGDALQIGRDLLVRLSDGEDLREEILGLYKQTHQDRADLEEWIDRSGLKAGKSIRRALRFLDVGLALTPGIPLIHRTDEQAAEVESVDFEADEVVLRAGRKKQTLSIAAVADGYDLADANDFRILQQLYPERIVKLAEDDPAALAIGILSGHNNKMNRDNLKLLLVPKVIAPEKWSDWWTRLRDSVRKSPNLRIEGRSPMFLIYDAVGQSPEQEAWQSFSKATAPREWLEIVEGYLKLTKDHKRAPDAKYLSRFEEALLGHIDRFARHKEPAAAFATALVIERLAMDGLAVKSDAHGLAMRMLQNAPNPVAAVASASDARLWSLGVACLEQAFPDKWPQFFAELILAAPAGQCDALAKKVEKSGHGEVLMGLVDRILAEPGRYTDALMWLWKGPDVSTQLPVPPTIELFNAVMTLVGPARVSEGQAAGQTVLEMRARVRSGLSAKDYARYRELLANLDDSMALAVRRQVERAEGLGPTLQDEMSNMLRARFPKLYVKPKVELWEDESVLYFSSHGLKLKQDELHDLVNVKMRENAKAIGEAASHGDLSENSEYKFALEERDLLRARVAKLNRELSMAKLLEPGEIPSDHVSIGQRVKLAPEGDSPFTITIMGANDSDITNHVYSYLSPLARQFLGKKIGERVNATIDDRTFDVAIQSVESAI